MDRRTFFGAVAGLVGLAVAPESSPRETPDLWTTSPDLVIQSTNGLDYIGGCTEYINSANMGYLEYMDHTTHLFRHAGYNR